MDGRGGMLELASAAHSYSEKGKYKIAVKVIDIWGERHDEGGGGESMTVKAIYENGVFRPMEPVNLPEKAEVEVTLPVEVDSARGEEGRKAIMEILSRRFRSGKGDLAERHNEHQP